jgi:guanosine-3',5'-bis(diphosphate) 3'-pyrophosphohydrolase
MPAEFSLLQKAISFAARAHQGQLRKDKETPYVAHPFRVCMTLRHLFGVDDEKVLAAAVLHDTVEDTTTDADDLIEQFGPDVARWVGLLSKDKRSPEPRREAEYERRIESAPWQVKIVKLADLYDNLSDAATLPPEKRIKPAARARAMLPRLLKGLPSVRRPAAAHVQSLLNRLT